MAAIFHPQLREVSSVITVRRSSLHASWKHTWLGTFVASEPCTGINAGNERSYVSFYRYIPLPPGAKADTAKAEFHDGVLEVKMQVPKSETRSRRLEINEGGKAASAKAGA